MPVISGSNTTFVSSEGTSPGKTCPPPAPIVPLYPSCTYRLGEREREDQLERGIESDVGARVGWDKVGRREG